MVMPGQSPTVAYNIYRPGLRIINSPLAKKHNHYVSRYQRNKRSHDKVFEQLLIALYAAVRR